MKQSIVIKQAHTCNRDNFSVILLLVLLLQKLGFDPNDNNPGRLLRTPYTTVFLRITWSRITIVYLRDRIRRYTEKSGDRKRPYFHRIRP
jgi:hypothetical protein